jgi:hypothetical protein
MNPKRLAILRDEREMIRRLAKEAEERKIVRRLRGQNDSLAAESA